MTESGPDVPTVVAITGASSGIGRATAFELARRGHAVVIGARRADRLAAVAAQISADGGQVVTCEVDVTSADDLHRFVRTAVDHFGRLDVLVSNAGLAKIGPMTDLDTAGWGAMIDVNLRGVVNGIAAALPQFRQQGTGHFVTVMSTAGIKIVPTQALYAGTKDAVRTLMEGLRQESTDGVVRTTSVSPGYVQTELLDQVDNPDVRGAAQRTSDEMGIPPDAVARAIAFAIEQPHDVEIGDITIRPTRQG